MLTSIKYLKRYGIFHDYSNEGVEDFGKFNLFYGWNGSGKSTLSDVFRSIENKTLSAKFSSAKFQISTDSNIDITHLNISDADQNIHTFNDDFVDENISWNGVVKSILLIDKTKIEERQKLEDIKQQKKSYDEKYKIQREELAELNQTISDFFTQSARAIKHSLQTIDTNDNYYLNYNKTKFEKFIERYNHETTLDTSFLDDEKIVELIKAARPNHKPLITFSQQNITEKNLTKTKKDLDELLNTSIVSQTIQRLVDHNDIRSWVETGLDVHIRHKLNQCEFCGNIISEDRIKRLELHFSQDYKDFKDRLIKAKAYLQSQYIQLPALPAKNDFYEEYITKFSDAERKLENNIEAINNEILKWDDILQKKIENQLETGLSIQAISQSLIKNYNDAMSSIKYIVDKHNHKSVNFHKETEKVKKSLELHYAASLLKNSDHYKKIEKISELTQANNDLEHIIKHQDSEIKALEDSLSNEGLGAEKFNHSLQSFLGRGELTLRFNKTKKGYEIIRDNSETVQHGLSEGEKKAIAFIYFITKLQEHDNKIEKTVVVIDDPISSFDSNHLFNAYSFIKKYCGDAKQLFVLTHNFTFFKLIRGWLSRKNKKDDKKITNFYVIEADNTSPRTASLFNASDALKLYNSEYHYIFSKLSNLKNQSTLKTDDHFLAANLSRKLLEAFLSFKFPKSRGNFANLFNDAIEASHNLDNEKKDKILKFINQYSHYGLIETDEDIVENIFGESTEIITDIFDWIEELDERHFNEMIESIS